MLERLTDTKSLNNYVIDSVTGCWDWTGATNPKGYGVITFGSRHKLRGINAHRLSWMKHRGAIPAGLLVLHKCDNSLCLNPDHLYLGSYQDNVDDMVFRGRGHGQKVTAEIAKQVWELISQRKRVKEIIAITGITSAMYTTIRQRSGIWFRRFWQPKGPRVLVHKHPKTEAEREAKREYNRAWKAKNRDRFRERRRAEKKRARERKRIAGRIQNAYTELPSSPGQIS